ncbi:hypothetical protein [Methylocystis sp. B8]|uniref:hypothetical protein n=1 Tax=Methylocystis sp. B8 TaxID=544938 RepID=UPI0010FF57DB|nr:hypothetical protein [Methylocystis sp. B8]TLG77785.1 hypothetical protein FEV16_08140 [Methylocystis sp. B8]
MTASIFVAPYWPFFRSGERRRFDYSSADGSLPPISSVFSYDAVTDSMAYDNFDEHGTWKNRWLYRYRPGFGVAEWRDDSPLDGVLANIFQEHKKVVFSEPIGWGEFARIGETYVNYPRKDPFGSTPPMIGAGKQVVLFEELRETFSTRHGDLYRQVLVFKYMQTFGGKTVGGRYFCALGVGPVAIEWIGALPSGEIITTSRIDASVTVEGVA